LEINTTKDLGLVNRAIKERWNVDREAIKAALMVCLQDPDLAPKAAKILLDADALDEKRDAAEERRLLKENEQRLRLLELAQSVPIAELAKLASENGIVGGSGQG
jgi:hypothetical protein